MQLVHEHQRHITAAQGYVELGMFLDANDELEKIDAELRHLPEVLAVRVSIYTALKKWDLSQTVAQRMALLYPDDPQWTVSWAYATRRHRAHELDGTNKTLLPGIILPGTIEDRVHQTFTLRPFSIDG